MDIVWMIIIGAAAGLVARFLMPGQDPGGIIVTPLLGIGGSFVATYLGQFLGFYEPGQNARFIGSVVGAIIILIVYRVVRRRAQ